MPDADFCSAVRLPFGSLSRTGDTKQISWSKLSCLPCAVAESTLRTLMDTDFAISCPLVRCWRLLSGFCPSTRTFASCFLRTPPRGGSPCIITRPSPPSGWPEDFHLQAAEHVQHTTKPLVFAADAGHLWVLNGTSGLGWERITDGCRAELCWVEQRRFRAWGFRVRCHR
jgi:hypothetical protein